MTEPKTNEAPSPLVAVAALLLLLVGGALAFFVLGGKVPAGPARDEAGHVHGPDCGHVHVHDENCDHDHDDAGHVHDENCDHDHDDEPAQPAGV